MDILAFLPPLNGSLFYKLLQFLDRVHHHTADFGEWWPGRFPSAPPASECEDTDTEKRGGFYVADVPRLSSCLSLR